MLAHLEAELGEHGTVTDLACGTVWTQYHPRHGHAHAAIEATETGTRLHVTLERSAQRKFVRRVGGAIGGVVGAFFGSLLSGFPIGGVIGGPFIYYFEPTGLMIFLVGAGIAPGNLCGRGAWRFIAPIWTKRLERLISTLSEEARRHGTPPSAPQRIRAGGSSTQGRSGTVASANTTAPKTP